MASQSELAELAPALGIKIEQFGAGRPLLMLHGGGGVGSVAAFAQDLADHFNVILPTHPGFDGTARPAPIAGIADLAKLYSELLATARLQGVLVMGFSLGGWLAAELAASYPQAIDGLVLVDAVGMTVSGQGVLDVFSIAPGEIADFSYHDPDRFRVDMASLSPERRSALQSNFAALAVYGGALNMQDPDLGSRLATIDIPSMVVWGESDRVATPVYGRAFADAMPNSRFELIEECGHLPQIERPDRLKEVLLRFARAV